MRPATKSSTKTKTTKKKKTAKRRTYRDAPPAPTAKQIEQSISSGKTVPLEEFVKGIKL